MSQPGVLPVHPNLRLLPLYILALLKSPAFTARFALEKLWLDIIMPGLFLFLLNTTYTHSPHTHTIPTYHTYNSFISMNRSGVKLDDRTMSLIKMKCLPLTQLIQSIYPDLYRVDNLELAKTQVNYPNPSLYCPSTYTYIIYRIRIYVCKY